MTSRGLLGRFTLSKFKQPDRRSVTSPLAGRGLLIQFSNSHDGSGVKPSLRAQRSNPFFLYAARWIASLRSQ